MAAPLTNRQKGYLAMLAKRAFVKAGLNSQSPIANSLAEEKWRHDQVAIACGRLGLRCCSQDHYGAVKGHFLSLLGESGQALRADVRGRPEVNELRVVSWKIIQRCREYGIPISKADGICRQMTRGVGLQEVEEARTLWNVFFKLRFYRPEETRITRINTDERRAA